MNNARQLLDSFLGQVQGATQGTSQNAGATEGAAAGGQLSGGLDTLREKAGQMDLGSLLSGKGGLVAAAGVGAGAAGLAGLLLGSKKTRKVARNTVALGGAALVGGLAYKAWRDWQANKQPVAQPTAADVAPAALPSPQGTPFLPDAEVEQEDLSLHLLRAMIAAAKADGHIDDAEREKIATQLEGAGLSAEHRAFVRAELEKPLDIGEVVEGATCEERAAEIYTASLLAIDPEGAAEKGYLAMLAARLKLDPALVAHIHANAAAITE